MTLVDSSVWIQVFRAAAPLDLERAVPLDQVVTCLPVVQEVLQGFRDEAAFRTARDAMFALPTLETPIRAELVEEAVGLFRAARRAGLTVRSSVDCLIAAAAIRHDIEVLHADRDFTHLARVSPLRERPLRSRR
jgi:predicted nucleic acid-binding protein